MLPRNVLQQINSALRNSLSLAHISAQKLAKKKKSIQLNYVIIGHTNGLTRFYDFQLSCYVANGTANNSDKTWDTKTTFEISYWFSMNFSAAELKSTGFGTSGICCNVVQMPSESPYRATHSGGFNERRLLAADRVTLSNDRCPGHMKLLHYYVHSAGSV